MAVLDPWPPWPTGGARDWTHILMDTSTFFFTTEPQWELPLSQTLKRLAKCIFKKFSHTHGIWEFLGQGLNPSHSCNLCHSLGNRSFNPLCHIWNSKNVLFSFGKQYFTKMLFMLTYNDLLLLDEYTFRHLLELNSNMVNIGDISLINNSSLWSS